MSENNILDTQVPDIGVDALISPPQPETVDRRITSWYHWLVSHVPETIRRPVSDAYRKMKDKVMSLYRREEEFTVRERRSLLNRTVTHYHIESRGTTSPLDFLNGVRLTVIRFLRERPRNKVQTSLICEMMRMDPASGDVTNEELASFNSKQESVFGSTDLATRYNRMISKVMEAFATYLKNGSGWMLKGVVGLDITVSRLKTH